MKKHIVLLNSLLIAMALLIGFAGCKKKTTDFTMTGLKAGSIDMNGATSPSGVPVNPSIVAVFSADVDASSASASTITLVRSYDGASVALQISVSGSSVTIVPAVALSQGSLYKLSFKSGKLF